MKSTEKVILTSFAVVVFILFISSFTYTQGQNLDPYKFFPANVGNRWEYTQAGPDIIYTIVRDSTDMKDSSRFIFFYNPPLYYGANYRIDKNYNIFYLPQFDNRHVYKLNAKVNDWWMETSRTAAKVLDISQRYVFGKLTTVKTIGFYMLAPGDTVINENSRLDYWDKLALGFGLISSENGATQPILLHGCRINGVTYGTVDVKEEPKTIPSEFVLYQNFPNPFNPSTVISYRLPVAGYVSLKVYDVLGREMVALVNEVKQPGSYEVKFDGSGLPSGVYFYRMRAREFSQTKKFVLLK